MKQAEKRALVARLTAFEGPGPLEARQGDRLMEFHVSRKSRDELGLEEALFSSSGNVVIPDFRAARVLARRINERVDAAILPERTIRAGKLNAMALIDEILHDVARLYREKAEPEAFSLALGDLERELGPAGADGLLLAFVEAFPPTAVYRGEVGARGWLGLGPGPGLERDPAAAELGKTRREQAVEELLLLKLANGNPAFAPFKFLFDDALIGPAGSQAAAAYAAALPVLERRFASMRPFGPDDQDLVTMLRSPEIAAPYSLPGQLDYIRTHWGLVLGDAVLRLLGGLDLIREEEKPRFPGPGPTRAYTYTGMQHEYERFTPDRDWMPHVVMVAKSALVWLHQLSVAHSREIRTLDAIPDQELDALASRGFNALWLIGLWERSGASAEIKRRCGNPEAAASAYSLFDYEIAGELGGWPALERLRERCGWRGIRLAADMVPNHTGLDSAWVRERPELFVQADRCPFPGYRFEGGDLSSDGRVGLWIEDHYYDRSDAAVVFKRLDRSTGATTYVYHGNDGTGMPWNDTAQIDFLKPEAREAVKERILHVARNFPIIRFDAAMILARRHFRRLWYPEPGRGGDVPSRAERAMGHEDFDRAMPEEFWREVVDLCARETPDTLLLAEAFWMMEGYFVRTLGMHRVYNSAFMNMLKREENEKYRDTIKNTQEFDKDILKRFVNFMNNPDEETAVAQFGKGDKYFGVCTMMATMPGLPMFGHGQIEGFEEKYGMEYRRAYRDERPDEALVARHEREIFPLLKKRRLFAEVEEFLLYDLSAPDGSVNQNVFAYSNGREGERALVVYNNAYGRAEGRIKDSCPFADKEGGSKRLRRRSLAEALGLARAPDRAAGPARPERFCAMREQRSGLWFLRASDELARSGLAVILDGYQSQVFLDIFEVEDDARGLYRAVHDALGGAGTPDLAAAVQDAAFKELYAALAAAASPRAFAALRELARPAGSAAPGAAGEGGAGAAEKGAAKGAIRGGAAGAPDKGAAAEAPGLVLAKREAAEFYRLVRVVLRDEAAEEGLPGDEAARGGADARPARTKPAPAVRARRAAGAGDPAGSAAVAGDEDPALTAAAVAKLDRAAVDRAAERFARGLDRLAALAAHYGRGGARTAWKPGDGRAAGASVLIADEIAVRGRLELALCYLLLDGLKPLVGRPAAGEEARRLADRLCFDRKLREALRGEGLPGDEAHRAIHFAKILLSKARGLPSVDGGLGARRRAAPGSGSGPEAAAPRTASAAAPAAAELVGLVEAGLEDEELRSLLGVNLFDGVTWFNKERFEEGCRIGALLGAVAAPWPETEPLPASAAAGRALVAGALARDLIEAGAAAGYRVDRLVARLAGAPPGAEG